jgi:sirohydrochlorin ferrochelatase
VTTAAPLVLAAHGSRDARFAETIDRLAGLVSSARPALDVRIGYLEHGPPDLSAVADPTCVVVPLLLSGGFHVYTDLPAQVAGGLVTSPVGPDPALAAVLTDRLREAGWRGEQPLVLAATGSADPRSLADVHVAARDLGAALGLDVAAGFLSAGEPKLEDLAAGAVASYLLAPGHFWDLARTIAAANGTAIVSDPLGADPRIAAVVLARYDAALASREVTRTHR